MPLPPYTAGDDTDAIDPGWTFSGLGNGIPLHGPAAQGDTWPAFDYYLPDLGNYDRVAAVSKDLPTVVAYETASGSFVTPFRTGVALGPANGASFLILDQSGFGRLADLAGAWGVSAPTEADFINTGSDAFSFVASDHVVLNMSIAQVYQDGLLALDADMVIPISCPWITFAQPTYTITNDIFPPDTTGGTLVCAGVVNGDYVPGVTNESLAVKIGPTTGSTVDVVLGTVTLERLAPPPLKPTPSTGFQVDRTMLGRQRNNALTLPRRGPR